MRLWVLFHMATDGGELCLFGLAYLVDYSRSRSLCGGWPVYCKNNFRGAEPGAGISRESVLQCSSGIVLMKVRCGLKSLRDWGLINNSFLRLKTLDTVGGQV